MEGHQLDFGLLGDQPCVESPDPLGFDSLAADLAALILRSAASTPFTIGIEAPWGMGKSSLMGAIRAKLDQGDWVSRVQFNAWTADSAGVLEGLIKTVLQKLDSRALWRALWSKRLVGT